MKVLGICWIEINPKTHSLTARVGHPQFVEMDIQWVDGGSPEMELQKNPTRKIDVLIG